MSTKPTKRGSKREALVESLMVKAAAKGTAKASKLARALRGSQLIERDGWIVRIDQAGNLLKRVARIKKNRSLVKLRLD